MWNLAVTRGATELSVAKYLQSKCVQTFVPYTIEKQRVKVYIPSTRANPNPRTVFKVLVNQVVRWPRYVFVRTLTDEELSVVINTREVRSLVRGSEGLPSIVPDHLVDVWRSACSIDGLVLKRSEILNYTVRDLLKFVDPSALSGVTGVLSSTDRLDDTGELTVLVGALPVRVHYSEVERHIA